MVDGLDARLRAPAPGCAEDRSALALFYLGAAAFAQGDKPAAARRRKTLLVLLPADAPFRAMLEGTIRQAE